MRAEQRAGNVEGELLIRLYHLGLAKRVRVDSEGRSRQRDLARHTLFINKHECERAEKTSTESASRDLAAAKAFETASTVHQP